MSQLETPAGPTPEIPDKLYFRIGEVARLAGVKPYVLRYWETEFSVIEPKKSGSNHRLYRRKDVEMILEIKRLLYDRRFTIEGARKALGHTKGRAEPPRTIRTPVKAAQVALFGSPDEALKGIRQELQEILKILN